MAAPHIGPADVKVTPKVKPAATGKKRHGTALDDAVKTAATTRAAKLPQALREHLGTPEQAQRVVAEGYQRAATGQGPLKNPFAVLFAGKPGALSAPPGSGMKPPRRQFIQDVSDVLVAKLREPLTQMSKAFPGRTHAEVLHDEFKMTDADLAQEVKGTTLREDVAARAAAREKLHAAEKAGNPGAVNAAQKELETLEASWEAAKTGQVSNVFGRLPERLMQHNKVSRQAEDAAIAKALEERLGADVSKPLPAPLPEPLSTTLEAAGLQRVAEDIWVRRAPIVRGEKGRELTDGVTVLIDLRKGKEAVEIIGLREAKAEHAVPDLAREIPLDLDRLLKEIKIEGRPIPKPTISKHLVLSLLTETPAPDDLMKKITAALEQRGITTPPVPVVAKAHYDAAREITAVALEAVTGQKYRR